MPSQLQKSGIGSEIHCSHSSLKGLNKGPVKKKKFMGGWIEDSFKAVYHTTPKLLKAHDIAQRGSLTTAG